MFAARLESCAKIALGCLDLAALFQLSQQTACTSVRLHNVRRWLAYDSLDSVNSQPLLFVERNKNNRNGIRIHCLQPAIPSFLLLHRQGNSALELVSFILPLSLGLLVAPFNRALTQIFHIPRLQP
jgi:hypothetical protein